MFYVIYNRLYIFLHVVFSRTEIFSTGEHYIFIILIISCIFHGVLNAKPATKMTFAKLSCCSCFDIFTYVQ